MNKPFDSTVYVPRTAIYGFPDDIATARNDLVTQALDDCCTHIAMLDTDQVYPEDALLKLLSYEKPVVGALVHRRYPPFAPILFRGELGKYQYVSEDEMFSGDLVEVDATGCGCLCFEASIFKKIPSPWFELKKGESGKPVGEDIRMCSKIRSMGIPIYVDTSTCVDHITTFLVNKSFYELFKQTGKERKK